jgi:hypothetical protein
MRSSIFPAFLLLLLAALGSAFVPAPRLPAQPAVRRATREVCRVYLFVFGLGWVGLGLVVPLRGLKSTRVSNDSDAS